MKRLMAVIIGVAVAGFAGANRAAAQESAPGPGRAEVTIIPAGGVFFTEDTDTQEPRFGNYDLGAAFAVNFNRYVGVEGEISGALGVTQGLDFSGSSASRRTPHLLNYGGNVVLSAANRSAVVPYITGGIGGLSMFEQASVGVADAQTFLTGNIGAGVKWYGGRWGLRGDYRFIGVQSQDDAPAFFGRQDRFGHRVYGAVILNVVR
jgi:hypothetical protein